MFDVCLPMPCTSGQVEAVEWHDPSATQTSRTQHGLLEAMAGFRAQEIFLAMPAKAVPPALGTCVQCTMKTSSAQTSFPASTRIRDCSSSRSMGSNSWATSLIVFLRFVCDGAGVTTTGGSGSSSCLARGGGMCGCTWWCCDTTCTWA